MAQKTKKFSLSPLGDRIVVKPFEQRGEKKLASGIIIPATVDTKGSFLNGEVIAVGPGRRTDEGKRLPVEVKPGATVCFKKPWDEPMKVEGVDYYVLPESDIILIEN